MSEQYVNRHGKKTDVEEALAGLSATEQRASQPMKHTSRVPKTVKPPRRKLPRIRLSRNAWLMIGALVIIGAIAALVTADSVKRDYERQSAAMRRSISDAGKISPSEQASASTVAGTLLAALSAPTDCRVTGLDVISWYGPAKTARQDCQATSERYGRLKKAVSDMKVTSGYIEEVSALLSTPLALPTDDQFAIIAEYDDAWIKAYDSVSRLTPPSAVKDAHLLLVDRVGAIKTSWSKLHDANDKQDMTAFKSAETELTKSYETFRLSSSDLSSLLHKLQTTITQAIAIPL